MAAPVFSIVGAGIALFTIVASWASSVLAPCRSVDIPSADEVLSKTPEEIALPARKMLKKSPEQLIEEARLQLGIDAVGKYNFAIVGNSGVGKSSCINDMRGVTTPTDPGWAPVGETQTTHQVRPYVHPNSSHIILWDLPGAGTLEYPAVTYFEDLRLYAFDCLLILFADRVTENDFIIAKKAEAFNRPCVFVRNKANLAIENIVLRETAAGRANYTAIQARDYLRVITDQDYFAGLQKSCLGHLSTQIYLFNSRFLTNPQAYRVYNPSTGDIDSTLDGIGIDERRLISFMVGAGAVRAHKHPSIEALPACSSGVVEWYLS